ncbi:MAG: zf-TFIIB domain-containing protein, partial [Planctomycetaceae bacterium]|nr:zf-TFIIB domain-containing protein [Planctomycetaceae bacterium]
MKMLFVCPRCHRILVPDAEQDSLYVCLPCGGSFRQQADALQEAVPTGELGQDALACPSCLQPMIDGPTTTQRLHHCGSCGGRWEEPLGPAPASPETASNQLPTTTESPVAPTSFAQQLMYGLSLPERLLRTVVGVSAGTLREAATMLVPHAFQDSVTYKVAVQNSLNFLTENVGGFASAELPAAGEESETAAGTYLAKKTVGNFVELAGMTLLPVSPLWLLAAVSDIAYGSSTYVKELAAELRQQGI